LNWHKNAQQVTYRCIPTL